MHRDTFDKLVEEAYDHSDKQDFQYADVDKDKDSPGCGCGCQDGECSCQTSEEEEEEDESEIELEVEIELSKESSQDLPESFHRLTRVAYNHPDRRDEILPKLKQWVQTYT